jgi:hypothetical protein
MTDAEADHIVKERKDIHGKPNVYSEKTQLD